MAAVIAALVALGRAENLPLLALAADSSIRLRYFARAAGFSGPLRAELSLDPSREETPPTPPLPHGERFVADLQALLPGVAIAVARPPGTVRSFFRGASSGVDGIVHLTARGPTDPQALRLAVPVGGDSMAEGVALTIDTALAVRRRFRPLVDRVRVIFDHSMQGLRTGSLAGVADPSVRDVHLSPAYALASEMEGLDRQQWERLGGRPPEALRSPLTVAPPFTRIDAVVAHEFWHQIEFGFESERYGDSVEMRRVIGRYFGVETLEQAIKGDKGDAPLSWQVARSRLATEVSDYATTKPKEATAELFKQWWCTAARPPPSAQFFGTVLAQFFPSADLVR
jgi:hypothetical protein